MNKNSIFKNESLESEFEENGYTRVPFLNEQEIRRLTDKFQDLHPRDVRVHTIPSYASGYFASTFVNDEDYRRRVKDAVVPEFQRAIDLHFKDYKVFGGGFLVKLPDAGSGLRPHQDLTAVDEERFTMINIWCPLQNMDGTNGALRVLKGSHRFFAGLRAVTIPSRYRKHEQVLRENMSALYMNAGEAVLYSLATLHDSEPNLSTNTRVVATALLCHRDAKITTAYRDPEKPGEIQFFAQEDDYFIRNPQFSRDALARPKIGTYLTSVPYREAEVGDNEVRKFLEDGGEEKRTKCISQDAKEF